MVSSRGHSFLHVEKRGAAISAFNSRALGWVKKFFFCFLALAWFRAFCFAGLSILCDLDRALHLLVIVFLHSCPAARQDVFF